MHNDDGVDITMSVSSNSIGKTGILGELHFKQWLFYMRVS